MYFDKRKKSELEKKCPIFARLSMEKSTPSTSILAEKGQKMQYFKTVKPINPRGRKRSQRGTSIKHPLSANMNNLLEQNFAKIKAVFDNWRSSK